MCDSTMCGFWVKLLLYLILGEYSFDIPHYTVPIQSWIKKECLKDTLGVTIYHFFGQSCFSVCIIYSDFRNLEMGFSRTKLKFWIHQVSELLTSLSGVLTLQGRRILQVKSLTAGPFASWKRRVVKLLRYLWKRSHDFTAELCWGQLCPTQSVEAEQEIVLVFLSYGNGLCGPLQSPVWWKNWQLWSSNFTLLCVSHPVSPQWEKWLTALFFCHGHSGAWDLIPHRPSTQADTSIMLTLEEWE